MSKKPCCATNCCQSGCEDCPFDYQSKVDPNIPAEFSNHSDLYHIDCEEEDEE